MTSPDLHPSALTPEIFPHGPDGLSIRLSLTADAAALSGVQALRTAFEAAPPHGVEEIVGALASVYMRFDPARTTRAQVAEAAHKIIAATDLSRASLPPPTRRWMIPVALGGDHGPQFSDAAQAAGLSDEAARDAILSTPVRVLTIGFAPGLPYMGLMPQHWDIPRLSQITPNVPKGALVTAVRQLIIFTNDTPTGWRHIGQTAFHGFDPSRTPATLLRAGDEIRFTAITPDELSSLQADNADGRGGAQMQTLS